MGQQATKQELAYFGRKGQKSKMSKLVKKGFGAHQWLHDGNVILAVHAGDTMNDKAEPGKVLVDIIERKAHMEERKTVNIALDAMLRRFNYVQLCKHRLDMALKDAKASRKARKVEVLDGEVLPS